MNYSGRTLIKVVLAIIGTIGFLVMFGSVGRMDLNVIQGIPDSAETIRNAAVGAGVLLGSLIINDHI